MPASATASPTFLQWGIDAGATCALDAPGPKWLIHGGLTGFGADGHIAFDLGDGTLIEAAGHVAGIRHVARYGLNTFFTSAMYVPDATSGELSSMRTFEAVQLGKPYCTAEAARFGPDCFDCSGLQRAAVIYANDHPPAPAPAPREDAPMDSLIPLADPHPQPPTAGDLHLPCCWLADDRLHLVAANCSTQPFAGGGEAFGLHVLVLPAPALRLGATSGGHTIEVLFGDGARTTTVGLAGGIAVA